MESLLEQRTASAGEVLIRAGDLSREIYFLSRGSLSILLPLSGTPDATPRRIATVSPGSAFGEMAMTGSAVRSATVVADTECVFDILSLRKLDELTRTSPSIRIKLLHNLSLQLAAKVRHTNRQLEALEELSA